MLQRQLTDVHAEYVLLRRALVPVTCEIVVWPRGFFCSGGGAVLGWLWVSAVHCATCGRCNSVASLVLSVLCRRAAVSSVSGGWSLQQSRAGGAGAFLLISIFVLAVSTVVLLVAGMKKWAGFFGTLAAITLFTSGRRCHVWVDGTVAVARWL